MKLNLSYSLLYIYNNNNMYNKLVFFNTLQYIGTINCKNVP